MQSEPANKSGPSAGISALMILGLTNEFKSPLIRSKTDYYRPLAAGIAFSLLQLQEGIGEGKTGHIAIDTSKLSQFMTQLQSIQGKVNALQTERKANIQRMQAIEVGTRCCPDSRRAKGESEGDGDFGKVMLLVMKCRRLLPGLIIALSMIPQQGHTW